MARQPTANQVHHVVLVERYFSGVTPHRLNQLALDTRAAAFRETGDGVSVTYAGSTAVPDDETCFCMFVTDSISAVERIDRHLLVPSLRIAGALVVGPLLLTATEIRSR